MSSLHLRALPADAPHAGAPQQRQFFLTRTNGDATPVCVGPYTSRAEADAAAKAMKAEYLSSRILIVTAVAEVQPVPDPLAIVEL